MLSNERSVHISKPLDHNLQVHVSCTLKICDYLLLQMYINAILESRKHWMNDWQISMPGDYVILIIIDLDTCKNYAFSI